MRKVGVLGGMGPEATMLLQSRLLEAVDASDDVDHIPLLIDMNPQVPSRLNWILENTGADPGPVLAQMASSLCRVGAEAIAMPCNTAHHFSPQIEAAIDVPFFHMPKLAAGEIAELVGAGGRVGILASPATQVTQLFERVFAAHHCSVIYPQDQSNLLQCIKSIKSAGVTKSSTQTLQEEADKLVALGADCLLIGCSEFSLLTRNIESAVPLVDSLDVLVEQLVAFTGAKNERFEQPSEIRDSLQKRFCTGLAVGLAGELALHSFKDQVFRFC